MTDAITRCPKCHTSFRLNDELLNSAKGSVRCGSCLTIFNAKENLIPPPESENQVTDQATNSNTDDDDLIHDDAYIPLEEEEASKNSSVEDEIAANEFDENVFVAHQASKSEINLFERRIKEESERELENADADESWALSLLNEDDEEEEAFLEKEIEKDNDKSTETYRSPFQIIDDTPSAEELDAFEAESTNEYHSELDHPPGYDQEMEDRSDTFYQNSRTDFLDTIEPEPLEIPVPNQNPFWQHNAFWLVLSVFAVFTLIYQIAAFNFDSFSRKPSLRPYYLQVCNIFSCQLPALSDLSQIKIENMVVLNHPKVTDMLLVDATLLNQADFAQAFPTLQLTFTNINHEIVSKMLFPPNDYVGGELSGSKNMPAHHPIHITLEIADPGEDAVNYQIGIVKP